MIRFLATNFVFLLLITSCSLPTTQGLREIVSSEEKITNPYFANCDLDYIYKAKIEVYKNNFGGILIIKKTSPQTHRIVMTTEFGGKILDMEYDGKDFTKNFIIAKLDRKFILKVLQKDFKILLDEEVAIQKTYKSSDKLVFKSVNDNDFYFYFLNRRTKSLEKIIRTNKTKEKVEVDITSHDGGVADKVSIVHKNIQLKIELEKFKIGSNVD